MRDRGVRECRSCEFLRETIFSHYIAFSWFVQALVGDKGEINTLTYRYIDIIIEEKPQNHIFNVGNEQSISILDWVKLCYEVVGADLKVQNVYAQIEQRNYFSFYDYEYALDVSLQKSIFPNTTDLKEGLRQSYLWYKENKDKVNKRDYFGFIDGELK
jgi:dTDP-D-glucose 4,6-dehydratase